MTFEETVGPMILQARLEQGMIQDDIALLMRRDGFKMDRSIIARLEAGKRRISLAEAISLCRHLDFDLGDLVAAYEPTPVDDPAVLDEDSENVRRVAKELGLSASEVSALAVRLWGRSFNEERIRRCPEPATSARRGHATRSLIREIGHRSGH